MLVPASQLRPGYRIFHPAAKRLATVVSVHGQVLECRVDHWIGLVHTNVGDKHIAVVSLGSAR